MNRDVLLRHALKLVPQHGFTRQTLALSAASLQPEQLSDSAVTALFGKGEEASKTLFRSWLEEGKRDMRDAFDGIRVPEAKEDIHALLSRRLQYNVPALEHLPYAFALLSAPPTLLSSSVPRPLPLFDFRPGLRHVAAIADEACWLLTDARKQQGTWYGQRAIVGMVYAASELHQLSMPQRSEHFLRDMLDFTGSLPSTISEAVLFSEYIRRSLIGIVASRG